MKRLLVVSSVVVLVGSLLGAVAPAQAEEPDLPRIRTDLAPRPERPAARPAEQLVSGIATFGPETRVTGMPTSTQPWHQVTPSPSVTVDFGYDWETDALSYTYDLDWTVGAPDAESATYVTLGFGALQGSTCRLEELAYDTIDRFNAGFFVYDNKDSEDLASAAAWNCAALIVGPQDPNATPYDAFVAPLQVTTATPQISLRAPKRDRLVKGVWTEVAVEVANPEVEGNVGARDLTVTGAGKGVKVRPVDFDDFSVDSDGTAYLWVKLARPKATLKVTARERGQALVTRPVRLRTRPAPARPLAGGYTGGGATFSVKGGKVRGFRLSTQTRCGGYPDIPTTTNNTYDFPTVGIPRNNEISRGDTGNEGSDAEYSVHLRMEFVSRTRAKGHFVYYGPARCTASDSFTVKRGR